MAVHHSEANLKVKMPVVNQGKRAKRRRSEVSISEPAPEPDNPPPVITCPVCDTVIPPMSLLQRWVDDPIDNNPGYVCSEACADLVADRITHDFPGDPHAGDQFVRRA